MTGSVGAVVAEEYAPSLVERGFWAWVVLALAAAVALAVIVLRYAARIRRRDVRGLTVMVTSRGERGFLIAPSVRSQRFRFTVEIAEDGKVALAHAPDEEPAYEIFRTESGVRLRHVDGRTLALGLYETVSVGPDLELFYGNSDARRAAPRAVRR